MGSSSSATVTCLRDPKPVVPPASLTVELSRSTCTSPPANSVDISVYIGVIHCMWYAFSTVGLVMVTSAFLLRFDFRLQGIKVNPTSTITLVQQFCMFVLYHYRRHIPYRCIGSAVKSMVEVIVVSAALALRQCFGYTIYHLIMLTGSTIMVHGAIQFTHVAYDIGALDVFLGLLMQVVIFTMAGGDHVYMSAAIYQCCGGVILYRHVSYCPPALPVLEFKKVEIQP